MILTSPELAQFIPQHLHTQGTEQIQTRRRSWLHRSVTGTARAERIANEVKFQKSKSSGLRSKNTLSMLLPIYSTAPEGYDQVLAARRRSLLSFSAVSDVGENGVDAFAEESDMGGVLGV